MNVADDLGHLTTRTRHVMLDFDGPVCNVFAGRSASQVADNLRKLIAVEIAIPGELENENDPLEFVRYTPYLPSRLARDVTRHLCLEEVAAVATATPTPGAFEFIKQCVQTDRVVTVVSNNSADAVETYLDRHGLATYISYVAGRPTDDPSLMKPSSYMLLQAIRGIGSKPSQSLLVGDSATDIEAAKLAGVKSIGYANKPGKRARFIEAGADAIVDQIAQITHALRAAE